MGVDAWWARRSARRGLWAPEGCSPPSSRASLGLDRSQAGLPGDLQTGLQWEAWGAGGTLVPSVILLLPGHVNLHGDLSFSGPQCP